jgi:hypothetical protein
MTRSRRLGSHALSVQSSTLSGLAQVLDARLCRWSRVVMLIPSHLVIPESLAVASLEFTRECVIVLANAEDRDRY